MLIREEASAPVLTLPQVAPSLERQEDRLLSAVSVVARRLREFFPEVVKSGIRIRPLRDQGRLAVSVSLPNCHATVCLIVDVPEATGSIIRVLALDVRYDYPNCPALGTAFMGLQKLVGPW